ncbi:MAG: methyltransferase family protein [Bryobacteraceae bacterium]
MEEFVRICRPVLWASWGVFIGVFVMNWLRIQRIRAASGEARERRTQDRTSDRGLAMQGLAVAVVLSFRQPDTAAALAIAATLVAPASAILAWWALAHLREQWRLEAVVTEAHRLVTSGPYAMVRHPIYTAFLGMVVATGLAVSRWEALIAGVLLFGLGTEIRVRAEERLLAQRFGRAHAEYKARVPAYVPFVR